MRSRPLTALLVVLALLVGAGLVAGCGADPVKKPATEKTLTGPGLKPAENFATGKDFFTDLASNDPTALGKAVALAAKGSRAAAYAQFKQDAARALVGAGKPGDPDVATKTPDGGYKICSAEGTCLVYGAITLVDGKINDFTIGGKPLAKRISLGRSVGAPLGKLGTVTFLSSYQGAGTDVLMVNLEVRSGDRPIDLDPGKVVYRAANGTEYRPDEVYGPERLAPGATAHLLLSLAGAPGGGSVDYTVSAGGVDETVTLRTR
ncbi:MAG: hypothetical protein ACJ72D_01650 [Marmoricola sp.]